jgi:hypothetical protein
MIDTTNPIAILNELDPEAIQARIDDLGRQQDALRILLRAARARRKTLGKQTTSDESVGAAKHAVSHEPKGGGQ